MHNAKNTQLKTHLKDVPLFSNMNDDQLAALARTGDIRRVAKGQIIVNQSSPGNTFYIVISGHVKVALLHEDGKEIVLSLLSEGNFFGELSLLDNDPRSASVIAAEDATLFMLSRKQFYQLITANPDTLEKVIKEICTRLRRADEKINNLAFLDVYGRTLMALQRLAHDRGIETKHGIEISHAPTHQELSSMVGTSRETVTRIITVLKKNKTLVMYKGRKLILRKYADGLFPQI
jgi:CRP/FNR family transcriptional regulator/CRP/FNR family cyclic AMP-dependent transcriptional regulator